MLGNVFRAMSDIGPTIYFAAAMLFVGLRFIKGEGELFIGAGFISLSDTEKAMRDAKYNTVSIKRFRGWVYICTFALTIITVIVCVAVGEPELSFVIVFYLIGPLIPLAALYTSFSRRFRNKVPQNTVSKELIL